MNKMLMILTVCVITLILCILAVHTNNVKSDTEQSTQQTSVLCIFDDESENQSNNEININSEILKLLPDVDGFSDEHIESKNNYILTEDQFEKILLHNGRKTVDCSGKKTDLIKLINFICNSIEVNHGYPVGMMLKADYDEFYSHGAYYEIVLKPDNNSNYTRYLINRHKVFFVSDSVERISEDVPNTFAFDPVYAFIEHNSFPNEILENYVRQNYHNFDLFKYCDVKTSI